MAGIEGVPGRAEMHLEPGPEVHRRRVARDSHIAEIGGAVPRWDVHAAAEGNWKMGKVPAHTEAFEVSFQRGSCGTGMLVAEKEMPMDMVADGLDARPAREGLAEQRPGGLRE